MGGYLRHGCCFGTEGIGHFENFRVLSAPRASEKLFQFPSSQNSAWLDSKVAQASGAVGSSASRDTSVCKHQHYSKPDSESRSRSQGAKNSKSISYLYAQTTPGPTVDSGGGVVESVTVWRSLLAASYAGSEVQSPRCQHATRPPPN
jgi:hypothetical protein